MPSQSGSACAGHATTASTGADASRNRTRRTGQPPSAASRYPAPRTVSMAARPKGSSIFLRR